MFDYYNKIFLDLILDINGALGVLRWVTPLFEFIYSF